MSQSLWNSHIIMPSFEKLEDQINTDVLILGGGICGILCAHFLKEAGVDYVLVEGSRIGQGITKNTTAKITSQHGLIYDKILKKAGAEHAKMYLEANENAILKYEELCGNLDCDFEKKAAYTYSLSNRKVLEKEVTAVNSCGFNAEFIEKLPLPFETMGAIKFNNQAQFHPMKFIAQIAKELRIYENTFIQEIDKHTAVSEDGKITAKKIIVATHFPFINKHGGYFIKMYQHRSYVLALENAQDVDGMYIDEDKKGMSFRNYQGHLLLGGGSHRTGKKGGNWEELRRFSKSHYPNAVERYSWATQDCMTLDAVPYIGQYSPKTPDLYVASGFNKWGMTSSMAAAMILMDLAVGRKNPFQEVFSPQRSMKKTQVLINGAEATINLLTPTTKRCPHLGCALKWNEVEHTWDCPCHGSRFEKDGNLIDNPATGGAKIEPPL